MLARIKIGLKTYPIPSFFLLTFFFAWGVWLPAGLWAPAYLVPLTLVGAWAPTAAAMVLTAVSEGKPGIRAYLARILRWRIGLGWYLAALFGIALIAFLALGVQRILGGSIPDISLPAGVPREGFVLYLPLIFVVNLFFGGPLAEDIGWRGFILPRLCQRTNALSASLIIGIVWAFWHLPFFLFPGGAQVVGGIPFLWFSLLTTAWSVLFAWVYVNTESVLIAVLFHAAINTTLGSLGILGQASEEMGVLILNVALTWLVVLVIVSVYGRELVHPRRVNGKAVKS